MPSRWRFRRQYQRLQIGLIVCLTLYASFSPSSFLPIRWVVRELQVMEDQKQQDNNEVSSRPNILLFVLDQWRYDWDGMTNSNNENNNSPPNLDAETGISDTTTTTKTTTTTTSSSSHNPLSMPFLREAASRGVRFTQAYVPVPLCAPVRSCLAAGKEYDETGVFTNHGDLWPVHQETFYKLLRDQAKYQVFTCGKDDLYKNDINFPFYNRHHLDRMMPAIDLGFTNAMRSAGKHKVTRENPKLQERYRTFLESTTIVTNRKQQQQQQQQQHQHQSKKVKAFDVYKDCFEESETGVKGKLCTADLFTDDIYPDDFVANEAIELLNQRNPNEPWFLQVNFPGPHAPQMSTASMAASVVNRTWPPPFDAPSSLLSCPQQQQMQNNNSMKEDEPQMGGRCNYAAELEHLDRLMAKIYHSLPNEDSKGKNQTVICIVGDHGDMLGDHSMQGKKVPWQGSIRVPMVCFGPGIVRGLVYNSPVTTLDLVGTFLYMAQTIPNPDMTTKSLRPILSGEGGESISMLREYVSSGLNNWRLVIQEIDHRTYKLICCRGSCHEPKKMESWKDDTNDTSTITSSTPPNHNDLMDVSLGITPSGDDTISTSSSSATNWNLLLYDTSDEFDMNPIDNKPEIVNLLRDRLPKGWCPRGEEEEEEEGIVITVPAL